MHASLRQIAAALAASNGNAAIHNPKASLQWSEIGRRVALDLQCIEDTRKARTLGAPRLVK